MKTILSHFYNEEYLLPWWLNHHKQFFDHGVMIDYDSTDRSVEIIKEICPTWDIVRSTNKEFSAADVDLEIIEYEKKVSGWKICLNVTEFLVGNYKILDEQNSNQSEYYIPSFSIIDDEDMSFPSTDISLHEQYFHGTHYSQDQSRNLRCLHRNETMNYSTGRHFLNWEDMTNQFIIFWYGYCPVNHHIIKRKLQIQNRIPLSDKEKYWGGQHFINPVDQTFGLTERGFYANLSQCKKSSKNLSTEMKEYLKLM